MFATAAGPLLSYFLMWIGMLILMRTKQPLFGFSLIFANLPFARFITVYMNRGDEMVIARRFFGEESWLIVLSLILLLLLPPVVIAFKAIINRYRLLIISGFLLLPLFFDALLKRVVLAPLVERWEITAIPVLGIPLFIIIVDFFVLTAFACCIRHLCSKIRRDSGRLEFRTA